MARDGNDVYSKPAGTTAVSGATIESAKYNTLIDDIVSDLNLDRPIAAGGTGASTASAARENLGLYVATFKTFAAFIADTATYTVNDQVAVPSIGAVYSAVASSGNLGQTNAGGQEFDVLPTPYWNVKAFGALGNGSADDTAEIQAAIDAAYAAGGGTVYVPEGQYVTSDNLYRKSNVWIVGDGEGSWIDNQSTTFATSFVIVDGWAHEADWQYHTFYDADAWSAGDTTITLSTASEAGNVGAGTPIFLFRGFPGNTANNALYAEIVLVVSADSGTGDVVIDAAVGNTVGEIIDPRISAYDAGTTYAEGDVIWHAGTSRHYASLVNSNTGNTPSGATDANWQVETIGITKNDATAGFSVDGYICVGGGISNISVSNDEANAGGWQARSAALNATYRDIYVRNSDLLAGGNAFNRCEWSNISGHFRRGALELAEGFNNCTIKGLRGQYISSSQTPKDNLFTMERPGAVVEDFDIDGGAYTWANIVRIGAIAGRGAANALRNGTIRCAASAYCVNFTGSDAMINGVEFIGDGSTATNVLARAGFKTENNAIIGCTFRDIPFDTDIFVTPANASNGYEDGRLDAFRFNFNRVLGTITATDIGVAGSNGELIGNYIETLGNVDPSDADDFGTWRILGNTRDDGDHWDDRFVDLFGTDTIHRFETRAFIYTDTNSTITLPPLGQCPVGHEITIVNIDDVPTHTIEVDDTGTENIQFLRGGGGSATSISLPPREARTLVASPATPNWRVVRDYPTVTSDGSTGGTGSAGAGNQYVEIDIHGTTYKVLHDGTV